MRMLLLGLRSDLGKRYQPTCLWGVLYTRIGSDRGNPPSTIMYCIQNIHTHSNGTTAPSRKAFPALFAILVQYIPLYIRIGSGRGNPQNSCNSGENTMHRPRTQAQLNNCFAMRNHTLLSTNPVQQNQYNRPHQLSSVSKKQQKGPT